MTVSVPRSAFHVSRPESFIVASKRTPFGAYGGKLVGRQPSYQLLRSCIDEFIPAAKTSRSQSVRTWRYSWESSTRGATSGSRGGSGILRVSFGRSGHVCIAAGGNVQLTSSRQECHADRQLHTLPRSTCWLPFRPGSNRPSPDNQSVSSGPFAR